MLRNLPRRMVCIHESELKAVVHPGFPTCIQYCGFSWTRSSKSHAHRCKCIGFEKILQSVFHPPEACVVTQTRFYFPTNSGLVGVQLPGMKVNNYAFLVRLLEHAKCPTGIAQGENSQIPAPRRWQYRSKHTYGRGRVFSQASPVGAIDGVRETRRAGHTIEIMMNRIDTRIVGKAFFRKNI